MEHTKKKMFGKYKYHSTRSLSFLPSSGQRYAHHEENMDSQVHFHAHSVKGSAATVGFLSLSAAAKKLDDVAKMKTLEGASEYLAELEVPPPCFHSSIYPHSLLFLPSSPLPLFPSSSTHPPLHWSPHPLPCCRNHALLYEPGLLRGCI